MDQELLLGRFREDRFYLEIFCASHGLYLQEIRVVNCNDPFPIQEVTYRFKGLKGLYRAGEIERLLE